MRIDKYLKNSRIIKRRLIAKEACDSGRVEINDQKVKAGSQVEVGDTVTVRFGDSNLRIEVLATPEHVTKNDADDMYRILED